MHKVLRWLGWAVGVGMLLIVAVVLTLYIASGRHFNRQYTVTPQPVAIPTDSAAVERGRHLASAITKCTGCHAANLAGQVMIDDAAFARLASSNLTRGRGSAVAGYTDADWVRAMRHGVTPTGRPLILMPSAIYYYLSNEDLGAIIAYVKSVPPVDNDVPPFRAGPIARVLTATGKFPLIAAETVPHDQTPPPAPPAGPTAEYGKYITVVGGCIECHGQGLSGGPGFGDPAAKPARNITPDVTGLATWTEADFFRALREGKRPDGTSIDPSMPWQSTKLMTDEEIRAVWQYLRTVEPKPYGDH